jgi:hypothetical protein
MKPLSSAQDETTRPSERLAVMISSTSHDLPHHRETVNEAIRRVGWYPLAMEHGSAEAGSNALSFSLRMVEEADLFIGIIAFRYGYVPHDPVANPNGWSVTEHEYRRAIQRGIPVLIFLMHDDHPDARKNAELAAPAQQKLEALKTELKTKHICGFFRSVDQLQARVIQSLAEVKLSLLPRRTAMNAPVSSLLSQGPLAEELHLLHQRIARLAGLAGDFPERVTNCVQVAGTPTGQAGSGEHVDHAACHARGLSQRTGKA